MRMKDGFYKNNSLGNRNLPGQVDVIVGSQVSMSGNIVTTYFKIDGQTFGVQDSLYSGPFFFEEEQFE